MGTQFVQNYIHRQWARDKKQRIWTMQPDETCMNKVKVLYQVGDIKPFQNMQLIFEITFHEEHPFKAPSIKTLTPNGRTAQNQSLCIDGLTAWHPESWKVIASFESVIERFMIAFLDRENVTKGVGFLSSGDDACEAYAMKSREWNMTHYPDLVTQWVEQVNDSVADAMTASEGYSTASGSSGTEDDTEYVYDSE